MEKTQHELDADVGRMLRELMGKSKDGSMRWENWVTKRPIVTIHACSDLREGTRKVSAPTLREALEKALEEEEG